jgi:hypothetical protein
MDTLTVTITDTRTIDGLIFAANSAKLSPEDYATWLLTQDGKRYADANSYGIVTSAGFFARFTPTEYANILAASEDTTVVPDPIGGIPTAEEQQAYDDAVAKFAAIPEPTPEDIAEYEAAVAAYQAACTPDNQAEIEAAEKQNADAAEIKALIDELTAAERVALDDQRVTDALALLVERDLLAPDRPAEIVKYDRPFPEVNGGV